MSGEVDVAESKASAPVWQRPPFEPGNDAAVKHGARSPALVEPRARELAPQILDANPHLDPMRDGAAVFRYSVALARIERVYAWLAEREDAVFDDTESGTTHGVYERLERWEKQADAAEERLALAPLTRARLGLDQLRGAQAIEEVEATREARARLDARAGQLDAGPAADDGGDDS